MSLKVAVTAIFVAGMVTVVVEEVTLATYCVAPVHWTNAWPDGGGAAVISITSPST
jgi:hypothetical protein